MAKFNADLASEVRVRKVGPFTITPIGGPKEYALWKQQQQEKYEMWKAQRDARFMLKRSDALSILTGEKQASPDYAADIQRRFKEGQERQAALYAKANEPASPSKIHKTFTEKLLTWFTNLKF